MDTLVVDKSRIIWASRRGMLELDIMLSNFANTEFDKLSSQNKLYYQQFLEEEDQDLFDWLLQKRKPDNSEHQTIIQLIRQFQLQSSRV